MKSQSTGTTAPLAHRIEDGADAAQIAEAVVATWRDIDVTLRPILGQRGVATLYKRSLHLTSAAHPWLPRMHDGIPTALDLAPLQSAIAQQQRATAAAAGRTLLQCFHELLTSLIGPSLTDRLLGPVSANPSSGAPAQDTSP